MTSGSSRSAMVGSAHPTLSADRWSLTQAAIVNRLIVAQLMLNPAWWFQVASACPPWIRRDLTPLWTAHSVQFAAVDRFPQG